MPVHYFEPSRIPLRIPPRLPLNPSSPVFLSSPATRKPTNRHEPAKRARKAKPTASVLPFRKPALTPLSSNRRPRPRTKLEALDRVVGDLEASTADGVAIDVGIFASVLEACYQLRAFDQGARVHRLIPTNLLRRNVGLSSKLLRLYASSGRVGDAHEVFDEMPRRDASAFAWNSLISGYAELGQHEDALALYFQMEEEGVEPDRYTFPRVLKACAGIGSIRIGEAVHRHAVRTGFVSDCFVLNSLVDMYAKCGDIVQARKVFEKMPSKDLVSWNTMLTGYIHHGLLVEAVDLFRRMLQDEFQPDSVAISAILTGISSLKLGLQVHGWVVRLGLEWTLSVANSLIVVYSNHGMLDKARWIFDNMAERDVVSWNAIVSAHSKLPHALSYFEQMEKADVMPDRITFVSLLSTLAHIGLVKDGEELFSRMRDKYGIEPSMEHYACMINLYGRRGMVDEAHAMIVERMEFEAGPTVWGALLHACYVHGNVEIGEVAAEKLFELEPDNEHNYALLIKIYENTGRLDDVEKMRMMLAERGLELETC
ncbi:hypothetical protein ACJRO7_020261 [Eucalyptus globulus]|uniref:Pentatricopeptide repeat-containing protein n=1 Tax=Eucalyptus globulus TaxID=34317 RepID=A0ABD3KHQ7_EUCGL